MIWVIGNVIRKAYTKFQDASSIANTQKSKGTVQWREYFHVQKTGKTVKIEVIFFNSKN